MQLQFATVVFLTEYICNTYILYTVIFDLTQRGWHTKKKKYLSSFVHTWRGHPLKLITYAPSHCPRMSFLKECSVRSPHVLDSLYQPAPATWSTVTHIYSVFQPPPQGERLRRIVCLLVLIRFPCNRHQRCKHSVVFLRLFTFISGYIGYKYPSK